MGEITKISWCDSTFNPWVGCSKVSPGCVNCYAETQVNRFGGDFSKRKRTSAANWKEPVKWNRKPWICDDCGASRNIDDNDSVSSCENCGEATQTFHRRRVFCGSLCDWLDDQVPIEWLSGLLNLIHQTPNLNWLFLTKRTQNWVDRISKVITHWGITGGGDAADMVMDWRFDAKPPNNVWIGTTVEDQARADERIPQLLSIPAKVRFLSCEPLLGPIDLSVYFTIKRFGGIDSDQFINWVIVGGESGPKARPCNIDWIRDIVRQCREANVACFVKQLGSLPIRSGMCNSEWRDEIRICGKFSEITHPKGGDPSEWPEDLRVQQFTKP